MIPIPPVIWKVLGAFAILAATFVFGWYQANESNRKEYEAQLSRQIAKAAEAQYAQETERAKAEAEYQQKLREASERVTIVEREVVKYVSGPSKKCPVSVELQRAHDAVTSLHDLVPGADGLPASSGPAGEPDAAPAGGLQNAPGDPSQPLDDSVMLEAYAAALMEYTALWNAYDSLREWVSVSYELQTKGAGR